MSLENKLDSILQHYKTLGEKLMHPESLDKRDFGKLSKEYSDMETLVNTINEYKKCLKAQEELTELLKDPEFKAVAEEELHATKKQLLKLQDEIKIALIPKDVDDDKNVILEIRAGTGGEEASLFGADLLQMYQSYASRRGWKFELISISYTGLGGIKDAQAEISGNSVFARMKFESGVHRVQRVPDTENQGRVHTSAATVAILPEAQEVDIDIQEKDLRIDVFRSSGPGGQSVNTTDSAVRITHIPTGVVVSQQDEKSQHKNRAKAMKILRARIYEAKRQELENERSKNRKSQIGSGDRSERIRTYNFPQSRVTDHRINLTLYAIDQIVNEGDLDEIIDSLIANYQANKLTESVEA
jgi:peptide chain release factor 1